MSVRAIDYEALGHPIRGPRALTDNWPRFWHLTYNIAVMQWKMRFFGSALGYLWQLMRPLLLFAVLYIFFTKISKVGVGQGPSFDFYGAQLLGSIVLFTFFAEATGNSVRAVVDNETLVRKVQFPRMVIPFSNVLLALFNLSLNLIVVLIFALIEGVRPMLTWLELPLIVLLLGVLATGFAMLLSAMFVYFRDIQPIWEVVTQVIFYASPVIISFPKVQANVSTLLAHMYIANPISTSLQQFRHAVVTHATPSASTGLGSQVALLVPIMIALAVFAVGFVVFNRTAPHVAEDL